MNKYYPLNDSQATKGKSKLWRLSGDPKPTPSTRKPEMLRAVSGSRYSGLSEKLLKSNNIKISLKQWKRKSKDKPYKTSWKRLPNIASFDIKLGKYNEFWEGLGVHKRVNNQIKTTPYKNRKSQRYQQYQLHRIVHYRQGNKISQMINLVQRLCQNSTVFRVSAWNKVYPHWHRKKSLKYLLESNSKITKIFKTFDTNLLIKRLFISKANGKLRPLGVPSQEWRIVGHMLNNFLYLCLAPTLDPNQHAYQPGKGCLSAWKSIFENRLLRYNYIYDVDLLSFFDNVMINHIIRQLLDLGFPSSFCTWLENINRKLPHNLKRNGMDSKIWLKQEIEKRIHQGKPWVKEFFGTYQNMVKEYPNESTPYLTPEELRHEMAEWGCLSIEEFIQVQWAVADSKKPSTILNMFQGFPQGFNTSPLFSIMSLKEYCNNQRDNKGQKLKWSAYADDIRFFSQNPFTVKDDPTKGVIHNPSKCSWIKYEGHWKTPFDWLGLRWDPNWVHTTSDTIPSQYSRQSLHEPGALMGNTRTGSRLVFTPKLRQLNNLYHAVCQDKISVENIYTKTYQNYRLTQAGKNISQGMKSYLTYEDKERWPELKPSSYKVWPIEAMSEFTQNPDWGFVQSRLYNGKWNLDFDQNFTLNFKPTSLMGHLVRRNYKLIQDIRLRKLTVFTSTSIASHSLLNILSTQNSSVIPIKRYMNYKLYSPRNYNKLHNLLNVSSPSNQDRPYTSSSSFSSIENSTSKSNHSDWPRPTKSHYQNKPWEFEVITFIPTEPDNNSEN